MGKTTDGDYVLGVNPEELARLGLQHVIWRSRALELWRKAGLSPGMNVIDCGAGPGFATMDLAEWMAGAGAVIALDRSPDYLRHAGAEAARRGFSNISTLIADAVEGGFPEDWADVIWCRWMLIFVSDLDRALDRMVGALKPGGKLVLQEYLDYSTWRLMPRVESFELFRNKVMESWHQFGGDSSVGLRLPAALEARGLVIRHVEPTLFVIRPDDPMWRWPGSFEATGPDRLVELGLLNPGDAAQIREDWAKASASPFARMVTPTQIEIIAQKPI